MIYVIVGLSVVAVGIVVFVLVKKGKKSGKDKNNALDIYPLW